MEIQINKLSVYKLNEKVMLANLVYKELQNLSSEYPHFKDWYFTKVVPGLLQNKREIVIAKIHQQIAGVAIIKDIEEKKICTLRIKSNYKKRGIGKMLFEEAFEILETNKPIITVPNTKIWEFQKILSYYNFKAEGVYKNYYKQNFSEISFNGLINESSLKADYDIEQIL